MSIIINVISVFWEACHNSGYIRLWFLATTKMYFSSKLGYFLWLIGNQCLTLFTAKKQLETECTPCCHSNGHFITKIDNISIIFVNVKRHFEHLELTQLDSDKTYENNLVKSKKGTIKMLLFDKSFKVVQQKWHFLKIMVTFMFAQHFSCQITFRLKCQAM